MTPASLPSAWRTHGSGLTRGCGKIGCMEPINELDTQENRTGLVLIIDNHIVNGRTEAEQQLKVLHESGWIDLILTDVTRTEWLDAEPSRRAALLELSVSYAEYYGPMVLGDSRVEASVLGSKEDRERLRRVFQLPFPGARIDVARKQNRRDAMNIATAIRYGANGFVTRDEKLLQADKVQAIRNAFNDFLVMSPDRAYIIAERQVSRWKTRRPRWLVSCGWFVVDLLSWETPRALSPDPEDLLWPLAASCAARSCPPLVPAGARRPCPSGRSTGSWPGSEPGCSHPSCSPTSSSPLGGRSVPPSILAVVMVLQPLEGLSDREAADRYAFDVRWRYAAGVADAVAGEETASFAHTVLVDLRARLRRSADPDRIFRTTCDLARQLGLVGVKRVLDSAPLEDAVTTQDTVTMLGGAIRGCCAPARRSWRPRFGGCCSARTTTGRRANRLVTGPTGRPGRRWWTRWSGMPTGPTTPAERAAGPTGRRGRGAVGDGDRSRHL
jgi:Transposase domain (DUF772)